MESLKPDCACPVQRKTPENRAAAFDETRSPVRLEGKTYLVAAISSDSWSNTALFLCNPDCVAEGEGFEPPVPFQAQRFSRPPVSTSSRIPPLVLSTSCKTRWHDLLHSLLHSRFYTSLNIQPFDFTCSIQRRGFAHLYVMRARRGDVLVTKQTGGPHNVSGAFRCKGG